MMLLRLLLVGLVVVSKAWAVTPIDPTAPTTVNLTPASTALRYPCPNGSPGVCNTSAELITALANGQCGDWILLNPANTYAPTGAYTLPVLAGSCLGSGAGALAISGSSGASAIAGSSGASAILNTGDNFLRITSSANASLPALGTRINTSDKPNMPTITVPNADIYGAFQGLAGVHHIRIDGLNMQAANTNTGTCAGMATCGFIGLYSTTGADIHDVLVDHNFMTGDATYGALQGFVAQGVRIAGRDNRITNIFDPNNGSESHGVLVEGAGPFLFSNQEVCAQSINLFVGDSSPEFWNSGTTGVGTPINRTNNGTLTKSYHHKKCVPSGARLLSKNLFEIKQGAFWDINSNVFDTSYWGNQNLCVQLVSYRGSQSLSSDISFTNNWVKNCPIGLGLTFRPTEQISISTVGGDGTTNCAGGPCIKVTLPGPCDCSTGDSVVISGVAGLTNANGAYTPITRIDSTHFTIAKAVGGQTYTSGSGCNSNTQACASFYFQSTPLRRVRIKGNLFTNMANAAMVNGSTPAPSVFSLNGQPDLTSILTGGTDGSTSTTGDWKSSDIAITHNTVVNAGGITTGLRNWMFFPDPSAGGIANVWQGDRWVIRDNVVRVSDSSGYPSIYYETGFLDGTSGLNKMSDPVTRDFSHNIGYLATGSTERSTDYSGSDTWILDTASDCSAVLLVSCGTDTVAAAALQAGSVGHNAASDGTDVGIDATALAAAVSGVTP